MLEEGQRSLDCNQHQKAWSLWAELVEASEVTEMYLLERSDWSFPLRSCSIDTGRWKRHAKHASLHECRGQYLLESGEWWRSQECV